jgi:hypothetical protein
MRLIADYSASVEFADLSRRYCMAESIDISCPECGKVSKAPADIVGKKIRCKQCQAVFVAKAGPAGAKPAGGAGKPAAPAGKAAGKKPAAPGKHDDEDEYTAAKNPYGVTTENLAVRCPFCALPMDPPDSRICLHCGYDMQKRKRVESRQTYEITGTDYFMYHLPTIGCFIAVCIAITIDVISLIYAEGLMRDTWFENEDHTFLVKPGIVPLYVTLATSIIVVAPCVRLIYKRLANFTPPEKIVRTAEDD